MSLKINNISSDIRNVVVERYPARPIPIRRYIVEQVPGRSGDLLFDEGAYENVEQIYEIYIRQSAGVSFQEACNSAAAWLVGNVGYVRIEDSYDPASFRYGYLSNPVNVVNSLNRFGRAELVFSCKPWRYLKDGEWPEHIGSDGGTIDNPTGFDSEPLIIVTAYDGTSNTIGIGDYTISIQNTVDGMYIDCELMDCYKGSTNLNNLITLSPSHQYPKLVPGENIITMTGDQSTKLEIIPRWRTL